MKTSGLRIAASHPFLDNAFNFSELSFLGMLFLFYQILFFIITIDALTSLDDRIFIYVQFDCVL